MLSRFILVTVATLPLAACGGPSLETRTFDLRYLEPSAAEAMIGPYVYRDRAKAPGSISVTSRTVTIRETRDNLERIARVLTEHDRPPLNVRLRFHLIRADGPGAPDSAIAPIEAQLRQLFRFRGYRLTGQAVAISAEASQVEQYVSGEGGRYLIRARLESVRAAGDSGTVRLAVELWPASGAPVLRTVVNVGFGQTTVLGSGQPGDQGGALILAVRAELAAR